MFTLFSLFSILICYVDSTNVTSENGTFFYFAYGSNLLAKRIHIKNPSAVFFGPAKLERYRLDFITYDDMWKGAAATIVEDEDAVVWGGLWTLDFDQLKYLDKQEDVDVGWYIAKNVTVTTPDGMHIEARTYYEAEYPEKIPVGQDLPLERRPSNTYLQVIALGAIESHLPPEYIGYIFSIPTNRRMASENLRKDLGYPF